MKPAVTKARRQGQVAGFPRLLGETLCLDFVNTVERRLSDTPHDFLAAPGDVVRWASHASAIDDAAAARLLAAMAANRPRAEDVQRRALDLRENAYAALHGIATTGRSPEDALAAVTADLSTALGRARLLRAETHFAWSPADTVHLVTDLVALDLNRLLTSGRISRVRQCPGCDDCGWLFLDTSRNGTRQWCSMEGCGSRAKMRRHYQRHATPR